MRQISPLACFGSRWVSVAKWPFVAFLVLAREHGDAKPPHAHGLSRRSQNRGELATVAIRSDDKDVDGTRSVASVAVVAFLPDGYYVQIPGHIHRAGRQIARRRLQNVFAPPSHHRPPSLDVVGSVVGTAHLILVDVRQRHFDELRVPPMFIQDGAGHRAHAVADQAVLEAHAFQRHVGGLAIGMSTRVSVGREDVFPMTTVGLQYLQQ